MSFQIVTMLMTFAAFVTMAIMVMWWARSAWWKYQAGRSIMALLAAQVGIIGLAIASRVFGYDYPNRDLHYIIFYAVLVIAMAWLGLTIMKAQAADRRANTSHRNEE